MSIPKDMAEVKAKALAVEATRLATYDGQCAFVFAVS